MKFPIKALTRKQIEANSYGPDDLWLLEKDGDEFGPYLRDDLCSLVSSFGDFLGEFNASRLHHREFKAFFEHPQLHVSPPTTDNESARESSHNEYYILLNGQKHGPLELEELEIGIKRREFLLSDLISSNNGRDWLKISEHESFVAVGRGQMGDLPFIPNEEVIEQAIANGQEAIAKMINEDSEEDAITSLAIISQGKDKKQKRSIKDFEKLHSTEETSVSNSGAKKIGILVASLVSFVLVYFFFAKAPEPTVSAPTKQGAINNGPRAPKKLAPPTIRKERPAPTRRQTAAEPVIRKQPAPPVVRPKVKRQQARPVQPNARPAPQKRERITHYADEFDNERDMEPPRDTRDMIGDERDRVAPPDERQDDRYPPDRDYPRDEEPIVYPEENERPEDRRDLEFEKDERGYEEGDY